VGKTWKDDKVVSRHKKGARLATLDMDLRTRTKPLAKKEKGGGKNKTKEIVDNYIDDLNEDLFDEFFGEEDF